MYIKNWNDEVFIFNQICQLIPMDGLSSLFSILHINTLSEQFKAYRQTKKFIPGSHNYTDTGSVASKVLTREIKEKISAAGFEAAAISAAISMEERAVKLYSESAETTSDPEAKALYEWLARWEREHLSLLFDIDKALREKIWFDNKFWPF